MENLPSNLRAKIRQYRFGYRCLAFAETICVAAVLVGLFNPAAAWLAVGWLGWRLLRHPSTRDIAAQLERTRPDLREQLVSVVELCRQADGSPQLRQQAFAEIDRHVAGIEVGPLLSLRPLMTLIVIAVVVNLAVGVQRQRVLRQTQLAPPALEPATSVIEPPTGTSADRPTARDLPAFLHAVRQLPPELQRQLPAHVRSLDAIEQAATRAAAGEDVSFHRAQIAEMLAEFARVAREIPGLAELADTANVLARDFARTDGIESTATLVPPHGPNGAPTTEPSLTGTLALALPASVPLANPWHLPILPESPLPALASSPHHDEVVRYFDALSRQTPENFGDRVDAANTPH